jgi:hypothetical protein
MALLISLLARRVQRPLRVLLGKRPLVCRLGRQRSKVRWSPALQSWEAPRWLDASSGSSLPE